MAFWRKKNAIVATTGLTWAVQRVRALRQSAGWSAYHREWTFAKFARLHDACASIRDTSWYKSHLASTRTEENSQTTNAH